MSLVLSEHLTLLATAPDGIQKLRGLILELAVRGKLVAQDHNDEPASELLKRIAKERARLEEEGICKKSKVTPLGKDEQPFEVPRSWAWARLGSIATAITKGATPTTYGHSYKSTGIRFVKVENISNRRIALVTRCQFIDEETDRLLSRSRLESGDILFSIAGTIGKTCLVTPEDLPANTNQALAIFKGTSSTFNPDFLLNQLDSVAGNRTRAKARGGAMNNVSLGNLVELVMAVPPLAEQHRIVAKVNELMALCDRLEAEQSDAAAAHERLVATLLGTLTQSADAAELAANWQRLAEHFDTLFTTESSLDALKQTILQLAYAGHLTASNCSQWRIAGLAEITNAVADIDHKMPKAVPKGVIFLSAKDLRDDGTLDFSQPKHISREDFERLSRRICPKRGDIIYSRIGARLGKARLVEVDTEFLVSYSCCVIRPDTSLVDKHYLVRFLDSRLALNQAHLGKQSIGVPDLGVGVIKAFKIPLPPLAEQHRIVAKVDELMALCDRLKSDLAESLARQERLAATLIESALQAA